MYDQNGNWIQDGCGTDNRQLPTVQFVQAQPEPYCPAPGAETVATQSQGRIWRKPNRTCRLELDDIGGNITLRSLLVIGNESCFTDEQLREIFDEPETTLIVRPAENCEVFEHQTIETSVTFTIDGAADPAAAQFAINGKQFFFDLQNRQSDDCGAFNVTRAFRCAPCENGELIQAFGGDKCSKIIIGKQQLFAVPIVAGATLSDITLCPCAYTVDQVVRCVAPGTCAPPPPAPPVCPPGYQFNANGQMVPINGNAAVVNNTQAPVAFNR